MNTSAKSIVDLQNAPNVGCRNDKDTESIPYKLFVDYTVAMNSRYLRARVSEEINIIKTIIMIPPVTTAKYSHLLPIWPVDVHQPRVPEILRMVRWMAKMGCFIHPSMKDDFTRREFYDNMRNGKIYNFFQKKFYYISKRKKDLMRKHLHKIIPGFVKWLIIDKQGNKTKRVVNPEGFFSTITESSTLTKQVAALALTTGLVLTTQDSIAVASYFASISVAVTAYIRTKGSTAAVIATTYKKTCDGIKDGLKSIVNFLFDKVRQGFEAISTVELSNQILIVHVVALLGYMMYGMYYKSSLINDIINLFSPEDKEEEIGDTVHPHGGSLTPLMVTGLLSSIVLPTMGLNILRNYRNVRTLVTDIVGDEPLFTQIKRAVNFVCTLLGYEPFYEIADVIKDVTDLVKEIKNVLNSPTLQEDILMDETLYEHTVQLKYKMESLERVTLTMREMPSQLKAEFMTVKVKLETLITDIACSNKQFTSRMLPILLWLNGPPGGGKSTLTKGLVAALYELIHAEKMPPNQTWSRNNSTEYDDGYLGQWHVDLPELFQSKLPQTNEPQAYRLLMMVDTCIYPLNYSGVKDKGKHNFSGKVITANTNDNGSLTNIGIKCKDSIKRRQTFPLKVYRNDDVTESTISNLNGGWLFTLADDARQNKYAYTGCWPQLMENVNRVWTPAEILAMMYEAYLQNLHDHTPADRFVETNWTVEELAKFVNTNMDENRVLPDKVKQRAALVAASTGGLTTQKIAPVKSKPKQVWVKKKQNKNNPKGVVNSEGYFDYFFKPTPVKNMVKKSKMIGQVQLLDQKADEFLASLNGSQLVNVFLSKADGTTSLFTTHVAIQIINDEDKTMVFETNQKKISWRKEIAANEWFDGTYRVDSIHLKSVIRDHLSDTFTKQFTCHEFVGQILSDQKDPYVATIFCKPEDRNMRAACGHVVKSAIYEPSWMKMKRISGGELIDLLPPSKTPFFPTLKNDYMELTYEEGGEHYYYASYWSAIISSDEMEKGETAAMAVVDGQYRKIFTTVSALRKFGEDNFKSAVLIGDLYYLVDLEKFNYSDKSLYQRGISYANSFLTVVPHKRWIMPSQENSVFNFATGAAVLSIVVALTKLVPLAFRVTKAIVKSVLSSEVVENESITRNRPWNMKTVIPHGKFSNDMAVLNKYGSRTLRAKVAFKYGNEECYLLFLSSNVAATTTHCVADIANMISIEILMDGMTDGVGYNPNDLVFDIVEGREVAYITFPNPICRAKEIYKSLLTRDTVRDKYKEGMLIKNKGPLLAQATKLIKNEAPKGLFYNTAQGKVVKNVNDFFCLPSCGYSQGDCGKPYLVKENGNLIMLGIHYGSVNSMSYLAPIYKEDVPVQKDLEFEHVYANSLMTYNDDFIMKGTQYIGDIDKTVHGSTKTQLKESPLMQTEYGMDGLPDIGLAPAALTGPAVNLSFKFHKGQCPAQHNYLRLKQVLDPLVFTKGFMDPPEEEFDNDFLSVRQAIFGDPNLGIGSLDQTTSTGPTLSLGLIDGIPKSGKRSTYFDKQNQTILPAFEIYLNKIKEDHEKGIVHTPLTSETMKDELRPMTKRVVIDGEEYIVPRDFSNGDLCMLIEHKRVFGGWMSHAKEYYTESSDLVGINPYGMGWHICYRRLRRFNNPFGLDISGCDFSHTEKISEEFFQFANRVYYKFRKGTKKWWRLRASCFTLNSCDRIWKNHIFRTFGKNPSGCLMTCILNGFFVYTHLSKCFYLLGYAMFGHKFDLKFEDHVVALTFGDDCAVSVDDHVAQWYNRRTVIYCLKIQFDIIATAPDKSLDPTAFDEWKDLDLLKRKFVPYKSLTLAPIEEESILKSLYWCQGTPGIGSKQDYIDHYEQILRGAASEYVMHGKAKYEWFETQFRKRFEAIGGVWKIPSYQAKYRMYCLQYNDSINFTCEDLGRSSLAKNIGQGGS